VAKAPAAKASAPKPAAPKAPAPKSGAAKAPPPKLVASAAPAAAAPAIPPPSAKQGGPTRGSLGKAAPPRSVLAARAAAQAAGGQAAKAGQAAATQPGARTGGAAAVYPVRSGPLPPGKPGQVVASSPGRGPVRAPQHAEELKQKIGALATATGQIRALKRTLAKSFYDVGTILASVQERKLFEVKGYGSFESFVERELDLGKQLALRITRVAQALVRDAALAAGLERSVQAVSVLDGESDVLSTSTSVPAPSPQGGPPPRPAIPPHKL
jgi:hypothetical protein